METSTPESLSEVVLLGVYLEQLKKEWGAPFYYDSGPNWLTYMKSKKIRFRPLTMYEKKVYEIKNDQASVVLMESRLKLEQAVFYLFSLVERPCKTQEGESMVKRIEVRKIPISTPAKNKIKEDRVTQATAVKS